jgi:hypothetical protein
LSLAASASAPAASFYAPLDFVFDRNKGVLQAAFDQGDGEVRNVTRSATRAVEPTAYSPEGRARSDW